MLDLKYMERFPKVATRTLVSSGAWEDVIIRTQFTPILAWMTEYLPWVDVEHDSLNIAYFPPTEEEYAVVTVPSMPTLLHELCHILLSDTVHCQIENYDLFEMEQKPWLGDFPSTHEAWGQIQLPRCDANKAVQQEFKVAHLEYGIVKRMDRTKTLDTLLSEYWQVEQDFNRFEWFPDMTTQGAYDAAPPWVQAPTFNIFRDQGAMMDALVQTVRQTMENLRCLPTSV